jgi:drug/metabolite transporter (DMT)-like permease
VLEKKNNTSRLLAALPHVGYWAWNQPWLIMFFTAAVFGANGVAARMATGEMAPMSLVCLRWFFACLLLFPLLRRQIMAQAPVLLDSWRLILAMGFFGLTAFNIVFYVAAYFTTAVNITLLQTAVPAFVLAGAAIFFKIRPTWLQIIGMFITFLGAGVIATHGNLAQLSTLMFNGGDLAMLLAGSLYAGYTLALRCRPRVAPLVFFSALALAAFLTSIPFAIFEIVRGASYWPSAKGWIVLIFIVLGPSLSAQLTYMRGVELMGPGRAGLFNNIVPLFGALFAIVILHEPFEPYHALALALGLGGVAIGEIRARR